MLPKFRFICRGPSQTCMEFICNIRLTLEGSQTGNPETMLVVYISKRGAGFRTNRYHWTRLWGLALGGPFDLVSRVSKVGYGGL